MRRESVLSEWGEETEDSFPITRDITTCSPARSDVNYAHAQPCPASRGPGNSGASGVSLLSSPGEQLH